jgi:hypothetical protein
LCCGWTRETERVTWTRTSTSEKLPADPAGEAVAGALAELLVGASVELRYSPVDEVDQLPAVDAVTARATGDGPVGWQLTLIVRLGARLGALSGAGHAPLAAILDALPKAGLRTAALFRDSSNGEYKALAPALRRAVRDTLAVELIADLASRSGRVFSTALLARAIDYLIELSGSRVESHDLTHGVVITDALQNPPRLRFAYPADIRSAKRAPLLFDGRRSILVVDLDGYARTELQRHRVDRLDPAGSSAPELFGEFVESGSLVAEATRRLGGVGFFLRADRTVWAFVDGRPLLVRRAEHWTAFPLELAASIEQMIGGGAAARIVAEAALMISAERYGAILAIVDDARDLDGGVSLKDRYDLRNEIDLTAMRPETRLHHLIDVGALDEYSLARLAVLDGATIVDRAGHLLAYGAIVASSDSQHEGARTAAAKTLSEIARVVLKVSVDGDITIFRAGHAVTTLLGQAYSFTSQQQ